MGARTFGMSRWRLGWIVEGKFLLPLIALSVPLVNQPALWVRHLFPQAPPNRRRYLDS
jgi:hypothetical protein